MKYLLTLVVILILGIGTTFAQSKVLIADETTIKDNKESFTIETSNESIVNMLINQNFKRYTVTIKKDRQGKYHSYSFNFDNAERKTVFTNCKALKTL